MAFGGNIGGFVVHVGVELGVDIGHVDIELEELERNIGVALEQNIGVETEEFGKGNTRVGLGVDIGEELEVSLEHMGMDVGFDIDLVEIGMNRAGVE